MKKNKITKLLIANRGEIAIRIMRAATELGIKTVAIYSQEDKYALHRHKADESYRVGDGKNPIDDYLDIDDIIRIALNANVDAIHPGYGFLSENPELVEACDLAGINFVGPPKEVMEKLGSKVEARKLAAKAKVKVMPATNPLPIREAKIKLLAKEISYPLMVKATWGGGGRGMRVVYTEDELIPNVNSARREAEAAFGNGQIYLEKLVIQPRHVEVQILGDKYGNFLHLFERDCTIQRRHQKLTEETPSPFMTDSLREKMGKAAVKASEYIKYEGAGTIEFLVDKNRNFYFMEMNTRIQVEHPITEQVIDYDLIKEQIKVASGVRVSGEHYFPNLHSIECRINAEDPFKGFRPSPGKITNLHLPGGHGVRLDTHVYSGYIIPPNYDSMIAKLIVTAQNRTDAIDKMRRALDEFIIEGIKTTIPFHRQLMDHPDYISGNYTTKFMEDFEIEEK